MNKLRKLFIRIIIKITSVINLLMNWVISAQISNECKKCGKNISFEYPVSTYGVNNIQLGDNIIVRKNMKLRTYSEFKQCRYNPNIIIGNNFYAATECHLSAIGTILIGNDVTLASRVTIIDHAHGLIDYSDIEIPVMKRELSTKGPIIIEDNVWIGEGVVVLGGVTIGKNSIIGANAVVTKDIPEYSIAVGIPAKVIKTIAH